MHEATGQSPEQSLSQIDSTNNEVIVFIIFQEVFEVRFAKMPEEPPSEAKETSDSSDEDSGTEGGDESSSGEDSESEAKRATQLSYLHEQVGAIASPADKT